MQEAKMSLKVPVSSLHAPIYRNSICVIENFIFLLFQHTDRNFYKLVHGVRTHEPS